MTDIIKVYWLVIIFPFGVFAQNDFTSIIETNNKDTADIIYLLKEKGYVKNPQGLYEKNINPRANKILMYQDSLRQAKVELFTSSRKKKLMAKLMRKVLSLKLKYRTTYVLESETKDLAGAVFWYSKDAQKVGYPFKDILFSGLAFFL